MIISELRKCAVPNMGQKSPTKQNRGAEIVLCVLVLELWNAIQKYKKQPTFTSRLLN